jgi:hypothetical protein
MHVQELLDQEVRSLAGEGYARGEGYAGVRHGSNPGSVRLRGQRLPIRTPRVPPQVSPRAWRRPCPCTPPRGVYGVLGPSLASFKTTNCIDSVNAPSRSAPPRSMPGRTRTSAIGGFGPHSWTSNRDCDASRDYRHLRKLRGALR